MTERILELNGTIAEESWFDDDVTPQLFKDELNSGTGDITVWINSPGGSGDVLCVYGECFQYGGTVKIITQFPGGDGLRPVRREIR